MFEKRIITIHDVADDTMKPRRLENLIKVSLLLGYKFVSLDEILRPDVKGLKLCLTIDDAYKSTITSIIKIVEKYNIKSTLFIPTGLLGLKANDKQLLDNDCYPNKDMMTWEDVHKWVQRGQDIGYHTNMHLDLYHNNNEAILSDFKTGIESLVVNGLSVRHFAYPKGFLPRDRKFMEELLTESGIDYAYTINRGMVNASNRFYIHRTLLGNKEPLLWSICKIVGIEDWHYYNVKQKEYIEVVE